jgi:PPOX class probable F420-dependent enzyme
MTQLTDKQAQLLLDPNFGSLAVLREDGAPEVTPVWVDWDGEYVIVNTLRSRTKPDRVRRDPRVELAVTSRENPYQHVRISGRAELTDEGAEEHVDKLARKYMGKDTYPRNPGEERIILRFRPERVRTYNLD